MLACICHSSAQFLEYLYVHVAATKNSEELNNLCTLEQFILDACVNMGLRRSGLFLFFFHACRSTLPYEPYLRNTKSEAATEHGMKQLLIPPRGGREGVELE